MAFIVILNPTIVETQLISSVFFGILAFIDSDSRDRQETWRDREREDEQQRPLSELNLGCGDHVV